MEATQPAITMVQRCIEPDCAATFGLDDRMYTCRACNGLLEIVAPGGLNFSAAELRARWTSKLSAQDARDRSGVWRYRELLPFSDDTQVVSLFEGNTPLYDAPGCAAYAGVDQLQLKHQGCNPTGSFKDAGMTTAVTQAKALAAQVVVCASTGNTAASLAAYAARAQMTCAILVPHGQVSPGKLAQSIDYGAIVLELEGNFDDAMRVIRELAKNEAIYLVNSINPFRLEGQKTVAFELLQQLGWKLPDHVVLPGGNLGNSSAFGKGFQEMLQLGLIARLPKMSVVQAEGSAPLAQLVAANPDLQLAGEHAIPSSLLQPVTKPVTLATAIKIGDPVSWKKSLRAVYESGGRVLTVSEQEIADAKAMIGRDGIGCEPASATTVAGIRKLAAQGFINPGESVVAILTGHVLKDADYVIKYHTDNLHAVSASGAEIAIRGTFGNPPVRVAATTHAILEAIERRSEP